MLKFLQGCLLLALAAILFACGSGDAPEVNSLVEEEATELPEPNMAFGFNLDSFLVVHGEIARNQYLADILLPRHVSYPEIDRVVRNARDVFDVRKINAGKSYTLLCTPDSLERACYFIYQPDLVNYEIGRAHV